MQKRLLIAAGALLLTISASAQEHKAHPGAGPALVQYKTMDEVRGAWSSYRAQYHAAQAAESKAHGRVSSLHAHRTVDQKAVTEAQQEAAAWKAQASRLHSALNHVIDQCHKITKEDVAKAKAVLDAAPAAKKKEAEAALKAADHTGLCQSYHNQIAISMKH